MIIGGGGEKGCTFNSEVTFRGMVHCPFPHFLQNENVNSDMFLGQQLPLCILLK